MARISDNFDLRRFARWKDDRGDKKFLLSSSTEKAKLRSVHDGVRNYAPRQWAILRYSALLLLSCLLLATGFAIGLFSPPLIQIAAKNELADKALSSTCRNLRIRREWRTLSHSERQEYFDAVHCLRRQPVVLAEGSLYDDFPYVHKAFGSYSHKSALFLPWHRWFIHIYEDALVNQCGYTGGLPYWNWVLDWRDITQSPVFDPIHGFGGDGNATGEVTVGDGRCITDGPFAGLEALRFDADYQPHCLSRGFLKGKVLLKMCGEDIRPEVVNSILEQKTFETFMHELEEGPHIGISTGIRGDWVKFTVPYGELLDFYYDSI
jgi:tyrosinase